MKIIPYAYVLVLLVLPFGQLTQAAEPKEGLNLTGVYILPGQATVLSIDAGKQAFEVSRYLEYGVGPIGSVKGSLRRGAGANQLALSYFDGQRTIEAHTTCAILDGHLWIGVFLNHRDRGELEVWSTDNLNCPIFGEFARNIPNAQITWNIGKSIWSCQPNGVSGIGCSELTNVVVMEFPGISPEPASRWATTQPAQAILPVFSSKNDATLNRLIGYTYRDSKDYSTPLGSMTQFGFILSARTATAPSSAELLKEITEPPSMRPQKDGWYYRRRGNIMLAPWSIDLGPAGMVPAKVELKEMQGVWISEPDPKRRITVVAPSDIAEPGLLPSFKGVNYGNLTLPYSPREDGVVVHRIAATPYQNNPNIFFLIWVPVSPTRALCFTSGRPGLSPSAPFVRESTTRPAKRP